MAHSVGLQTKRDAWVYNFSTSRHIDKCSMIDLYNDQVALLPRRRDLARPFAESTRHDSAGPAMLQKISRGKTYKLTIRRGRVCVYRHSPSNASTSTQAQRPGSASPACSRRRTLNIGIYVVAQGRTRLFAVSAMQIPDLASGFKWRSSSRAGRTSRSDDRRLDSRRRGEVWSMATAGSTTSPTRRWRTTGRAYGDRCHQGRHLLLRLRPASLADVPHDSPPT